MKHHNIFFECDKILMSYTTYAFVKKNISKISVATPISIVLRFIYLYTCSLNH